MAIVDKLVNAALSAAQTSVEQEYRVGAAAYRSGRLLAIGYNSNKTDPQAHNFTKRIHAEHALFLNAGRDLTDATVMVLRLGRKHAVGRAKPCETCLPLLRQAGVRRILYTEPDQTIRDIDTGKIVGHIQLKLQAIIIASE
jgi:deoxycytidylate deaminase